jgi:hypothetical protein
VFPAQDDGRSPADSHDPRGALFAERAARVRTEQHVAEQRQELERLAAELRAFTVLRDNFHDLYRLERDGRIAAERVAAECITERERSQDELHRLRSENAQLRADLDRVRRPRPLSALPERELRGAPHVDWMPRLVEDR